MIKGKRDMIVTLKELVKICTIAKSFDYLHDFVMKIVLFRVAFKLHKDIYN